jgi:hypothetical protein
MSNTVGTPRSPFMCCGSPLSNQTDSKLA